MDLDWVQWPAMVATLLASWLVAAESKWKRHAGFWVFLLSNLLWVAWSIPAHAYALIGLQIGLVVMNLRGLAKTEAPAAGARQND